MESTVVVYTYRCKSGPICETMERLVYDQLRKSVTYYNALIERLLEERKEVDRFQCLMRPDLVVASSSVERLEQHLEECNAAIKQKNSASRKRGQAKEERAAKKKVLADLRFAKARLGKIRQEIKEDEELQDQLNTIRNNVKPSIKGKDGLRRKSGLGWGTYLDVDAAFNQARRTKNPQFNHFSGEGSVSVHLQDPDKQLPESVFNSTNDQFLITRGVKYRNNVHYARLNLRNGQERGVDHWVIVPIFMDRPLPKKCRIKVVRLVARRVATKTKWSIQITVEVPKGSHKDWASKNNQAAAVDLNWRKVPTGLRVASWAGTDGLQGEVVIPTNVLNRWRKCFELSSTRDNNFNECRETLAVWLSVHEHPEELAEMLDNLRLWRSQARLARVVLWWRNHRFDGDGQIYEYLENWRKQDKHLYEWCENNRRKAIDWRNDYYRKEAKKLAMAYGVSVFEDLNLKEMGESEPEDAKVCPGTRNKTIASPGTLRRYFEEAIRQNRRVPAAYSTITCSECLEVCKFDNPGSQFHTCEHCGANWDRDFNSPQNLLRKWLEGKSEPAQKPVARSRKIRKKKRVASTETQKVSA